MTASFRKRIILTAVLCFLCTLFALHSALADPYPSNVHVTPVDETTIRITWSENAWAQSYRVYRNLELAADLNKSVTEFLDTGLTPGMAYYYRVCSVVDGVEYASPVDTSSWAVPLNAPVITSLDASPDFGQGIIQVNIAWTPVGEATGYEVFLMQEGTGGYEQKTETIDLYAPDGLLLPNEETTYWYKVRAYEIFHFQEAGEDQYFTGPFSEPWPLVYTPIQWGKIGAFFLYEKVWPWPDPWQREWLEDLLAAYANPEKWPQSVVLGSKTLAQLAKSLSEHATLSDAEQQVAAAIHPHGLALLIGAYQSPPNEDSAQTLSGELHSAFSLLDGRLPDQLDSGILDQYYERLQALCGLVNLDGSRVDEAGTALPDFEITSRITKEVVLSSRANASSLLIGGIALPLATAAPTLNPRVQVRPARTLMPLSTPAPNVVATPALILSPNRIQNPSLDFPD